MRITVLSDDEPTFTAVGLKSGAGISHRCTPRLWSITVAISVPYCTLADVGPTIKDQNRLSYGTELRVDDVSR